MKPHLPSRKHFSLSISWSVLALFVLLGVFVLGNLPAARASSDHGKSCSLLFPLSSSNSEKASGLVEGATEPLTSEELLRKILPQPENLQWFESCGQGCLQLSEQAQAKFFSFPRLRVKFMGSRQPHLALTEKVAREMRGSELKMIDPSKSSQHIYTTDKTLILPEDWMNQKLSVQQMQLFQEAWMQLLMGHPLHPYTESPFYQDKPFRWKESQIQALKAISDVRQQGKKSLLLVGSGGTGKTKIITTELRRQILLEKNQDPSARKPLHLVIANTVEHARALQEKISQEKIPGTRVLRWDGHIENKDLESLYQQMKSSDQALILVTVVNSFRQQIYQDLDHHTEQMQKYLSQIIIDEAHHAGAELLRGFLEKVMTPSSSLSTATPFLLGLTATPVHHEIGLQNLFGQNSFFMNLDTSIQNLQSERPLTEVMDQLQRTSALGEVTPLENVHILTPEVLQIDRDQLTIKNEELTNLSSEKDGRGQRRVLNPQIYPQIFSFLSPLYVSDKASLTTAGSIASAENMFAYFQKAFPGHRSQRLHSQMSSEQKKEIAEDFRQGKIQHLIVVDMMNEAFDKPDLEVLVDLSISSSPIQMIQRLARPARLYDHKEKVTAVMMMGVTDAYLDEQLQLLDRLHENQKKTRITKSHQGSILVQNIARLPRIMDHYADLRQSLSLFWEKRIFRTREEWIQEISAWVREADQSNLGRWTPLRRKDSFQDKREASLGWALKNMKVQLKKEGKLDWWTVFPVDVQDIWRKTGVLEKKRRTREEIIQEISVWVREADQSNLLRRTPLPGKDSDQDEREAYLGQAFVDFKYQLKKEGKLDWWTVFPVDVQDIWRKAGVLEKKIRTQDEWIQEISVWVKEADRSNLGRWTPLSGKKYAQDKREATLGRALIKIKVRLKKEDKLDWWTLFPEDVQDIWRKAGVLEKKIRTQDEWIQEISAWVRERDADQNNLGRWTPLQTIKTAQDDREASLGKALSKIKFQLKKQGKLDWWTLFPVDVQDIWREAKVIPAK